MVPVFANFKIAEQASLKSNLISNPTYRLSRELFILMLLTVCGLASASFVLASVDMSIL